MKLSLGRAVDLRKKESGEGWEAALERPAVVDIKARNQDQAVKFARGSKVDNNLCK